MDLPVVLGYVAAAGSVDLYNINVAAPQRITLWETSVAHTALAYGVLAVISALLPVAATAIVRPCASSDPSLVRST